MISVTKIDAQGNIVAEVIARYAHGPCSNLLRIREGSCFAVHWLPTIRVRHPSQIKAGQCQVLRCRKQCAWLATSSVNGRMAKRGRQRSRRCLLQIGVVPPEGSFRDKHAYLNSAPDRRQWYRFPQFAMLPEVSQDLALRFSISTSGEGSCRIHAPSCRTPP